MPADIELTSPHGSVRIKPLGAHVISARLFGRDLLWLTPRPALPLRGGVPVCFPWFGGAGSPPHGFARRLPWQLESSAPGEATLVLDDSPETMTIWPHQFRAALSVSLGSTVDFALAVTNTDSTPFSITYALHTYFAVSDLSTWRLDGLGAPVTATQPVDAVYEHAPDRLTFDRLYVDSTNMPSAVVWNPGANDVADIGSSYRDFVCVERGCIGSAAISLEPGARHVGTMRIGVMTGH